MSFYGVGLNSAVNKLNMDFKFLLASKQGGTGVRKLAQAFVECDLNNDGYVDFDEFMKILGKLGLFCKLIEAQSLFTYYDLDKDGRISYTEFITNFRKPLSPRRERLVRTVFDRLDVNRDGVLSPKELGYVYQVNSNYDVVQRNIGADEATKQFFDLFDKNGDGKISWEEFRDYYRDIGVIIQGETSFKELLTKTWDIKLDDSALSKELIKKYTALIREKLLIHTTENLDEFKLQSIFSRLGSSGKSNLLSLNDFDALLLDLTLDIPEKDLKQLFEHFSEGGNFVEFGSFEKYILYDPYK